MTLSTLLNDPQTVATGVAAVSGVAAWVCTLLPAPKEGSSIFYRIVYSLLNWVGANKGKASNADDVLRSRLTGK